MGKGYSEHKVYKCDYCKLEAVFDSEEAVKRHHKACLMNPDNKFPLTNKNVVLKVFGFAKRNYKDWKYDKTYFQLTPYMRAFNTFTDKFIDEEDLYKEDETWEPREDGEEIEIVKTNDYIAFMELLDKNEEVEEISDDIKAFASQLNFKT